MKKQKSERKEETFIRAARENRCYRAPGPGRSAWCALTLSSSVGGVVELTKGLKPSRRIQSVIKVIRTA